ncbi:MAG: hypothetical protein HUK19_06455 [Fibrobacter sp.]|nr:hypothetical protein [Fibrobacter sp.]
MGIIGNILTLGAQGRIEDAQKSFNRKQKEVQERYEVMEAKRKQLGVILESVVEKKKAAAQSLKKIKKITDHLKGKERVFENQKINGETINLNFEYVEKSLDAIDAAMNLGKGAGTGLASGAAAYWLVGELGAASTGTAISTLFGAAKANAILAWLGGGSVAAGGGGIAVGSTVLGGIVALPALAAMGIFQHAKANKVIKEIKEQKYELIEMLDKIEKNILSFDAIGTRAEEIQISLEKTQIIFETELEKVYKKLYPNVFSGLYRSLRKKFGGKYFNEEDLKEISYIGQIATNFAKIIDAKVIENKEG